MGVKLKVFFWPCSRKQQTRLYLSFSFSGKSEKERNSNETGFTETDLKSKFGRNVGQVLVRCLSKIALEQLIHASCIKNRLKTKICLNIYHKQPQISDSFSYVTVEVIHVFFW